MWTAYVLKKNIQRFQTLLDDPGTAEETRKVLVGLLAEAKAKLSELGHVPWATGRPPDRRD